MLNSQTIVFCRYLLFQVNLSKLKESHEVLASENAKLHNEIIKLREQNAKERKIAQVYKLCSKNKLLMHELRTIIVYQTKLNIDSHLK